MRTTTKNYVGGKKNKGKAKKKALDNKNGMPKRHLRGDLKNLKATYVWRVKEKINKSNKESLHFKESSMVGNGLLTPLFPT